MAIIPSDGLSSPVQYGLHGLYGRAIQEGTSQRSVFGVGISFAVITAIVIGLRIYVRVVLIQGGLGADDFLMVAGAICNFGLSIANMVCAWYGAGVHMPDIPSENFEPLLKSNYANRLLYIIALCLVKLSILVFYMRLDHRKWTRWAIYFLMFTVIGLTIATVLICAFSCWPPSLFWDVTGLKKGSCMSNAQRQIFFEANGIINIVQDVGIYVLPIPMLAQLQVPRRQKIALIGLFCVGFVALAAGCVRYYYVLKLANEEDIWYYFAASLNWCSIEVYVAIICGSASTFKVLLKTYLPRLWGSSHRSASHGARHQYDHSRSGTFALKNFEPSSKLARSGKRGIHDVTNIERNSEEAIITSGTNTDAESLPGNPGRDGKGETRPGCIAVKKEITMEISAYHPDEGHDHLGHIPQPLQAKSGKSKRISGW